LLHQFAPFLFASDIQSLLVIIRNTFLLDSPFQSIVSHTLADSSIPRAFQNCMRADDR
jgi:hypothetical protein